MNWVENGKAIAVIVLFLSVSALNGQTAANSAQQRTVTKADFEKLEAIADAKLEKLSYREKTTKFLFKDGSQSPDFTSKTTIELVRPNRNRMVFEATGDEVVPLTETIQIGNKEFSKEGNAPWKVSIPKKPAQMTNIAGERHSYIIDITDKDEILYLGREDLNGHIADVYRLTTPLIDLSFLGSNQVVKKQWFDKRGRILRTEVDWDRGNNVSRQLLRTVTEYEYDITIKIEAPIK